MSPAPTASAKKRPASEEIPHKSKRHSLPIDDVVAWVKTVLYMQLIDPGDSVLELFCHKGQEAKRWSRLPLGRYVGVDPADTNLKDAHAYWTAKVPNSSFPIEFIQQDPRSGEFIPETGDSQTPGSIRLFEGVCCHGSAFTMCFSSEEQARGLLRCVSAALRGGGVFFGVLPDASAIWHRAQKSQASPPSFKGDGYAVIFESKTFSPFGSQYRLKMYGEGGKREETHMMVHFPTLLKLAREVGLEAVEIPNLLEFYEDYHQMFGPQLRACIPHRPLDRQNRIALENLQLCGLHAAFVFYRAHPRPPLPPLNHSPTTASEGSGAPEDCSPGEIKENNPENNIENTSEKETEKEPEKAEEAEKEAARPQHEEEREAQERVISGHEGEVKDFTAKEESMEKDTLIADISKTVTGLESAHSEKVCVSVPPVEEKNDEFPFQNAADVVAHPKTEAEGFEGCEAPVPSETAVRTSEDQMQMDFEARAEEADARDGTKIDVVQEEDDEEEEGECD